MLTKEQRDEMRSKHTILPKHQLLDDLDAKDAEIAGLRKLLNGEMSNPADLITIGETMRDLTKAEDVLHELDMRATTLLCGGLVPSDFAREVQKASRAYFADKKEKADAIE